MEMIVSGEITDALTILALQRAWFRLRADGVPEPHPPAI